ncbi:putative disease resistance protein RGA1 [Aegilops tauschii subsp. strangulata]|nr:putative disease resistance protein RGA1 [Triticum aestivum]
MQTHCDSISDLLGNIPSSSMAVTLHRPQIGSTIIQDTLYGRRHTFEETVNRVISCEDTVSVLPIVGPGVLEKQLSLNTSIMMQGCIVILGVKIILKSGSGEILGCIPEQEGINGVANETTNLDQLQKSIAHRLKSKRFLIVLDDIWKCDGQDQWKTLLAPFTKGETKGSMVIVTTRFPKVADMVKTLDPLELRGLESNDFFTFFEACIFGDHKPEHYEYELADIAGKIANKLKGSPLAAKTVGGLLRKDLSQEHWNEVLKKHEWLKQQNNDEIMPSLKISYD